jgi:toxin ParE1/3/4
MLVHFHDEADADAQSIHDAFANDSLAKGAKFQAAFMRAVETIQQYPESGHPVVRGIRRKLIRGYPYSVIYRPSADYVYVIAIAHFKQKWGYWWYRVEQE